MNWTKRISWEEPSLVGLTLLWMWIGSNGTAAFHLLTVGLMGLILSLGLTRGLFVALSRTGIVTLSILIAEGWKGQAHPAHLANATSMMACAVLAGFLGDRQRKTQEALKRGFSETLEGLAHALEARDPYTEGHSRRTSEIALTIAQELGLDEKAKLVIQQAGILHDLGKIGTPDAILRKNGSLTLDEKRIMHAHPVVGSQILKGISFLEEAAILVLHHHEHYDGTGYPDALVGSAIPLGDRILAAADALDALTTDRPYHKAISYGEAVVELEKGAGYQFDPAVIDALKRSYRSPSAASEEKGL